MFKQFKPLIWGLILVVASASGARAASVSESIVFNKTKYFFDIYPGIDQKPKPAIIILPEIWGKDNLEAVQAQKLSEAGYVVLVMDLYGHGVHTKIAKEAEELAAKAEADGFEPIYKLFSEAVKIMRARKDVDHAHIGVVGYGYGGGIATNLAKRAQDHLTVAVSFYGGLKDIQTINMVDKKPAVLYFHPKYDNYSFDSEIKAFNSKMTGNGVELKIVDLPDSHYAFVHEGIESYGHDAGNTFMFFDKKAADESWKVLLEFLKKYL